MSPSWNQGFPSVVAPRRNSPTAGPRGLKSTATIISSLREDGAYARFQPLKTARNHNWERPYSREQAAFPARWLREHKFWPAVGRIDNVFGDRNPVCSCVGMEAYGGGGE